jgi:hypothetical protein
MKQKRTIDTSKKDNKESSREKALRILKETMSKIRPIFKKRGLFGGEDKALDSFLDRVVEHMRPDIEKIIKELNKR